MNLVNYIETSRTWKDKIVQIHVADNGDVALIPRKGKEMFIIGQPTSLEDTERETIRRALIRNNGKRKKTALELQISERTLYRKIKEYNLE